jgi:hypothetical protein
VDLPGKASNHVSDFITETGCPVASVPGKWLWKPASEDGATHHEIVAEQQRKPSSQRTACIAGPDRFGNVDFPNVSQRNEFCPQARAHGFDAVLLCLNIGAFLFFQRVLINESTDLEGIRSSSFLTFMDFIPN